MIVTSFDVILGLKVTEYVTEVDMEKLPVSLNHVVARVTITNTHDVGCD